MSPGVPFEVVDLPVRLVSAAIPTPTGFALRSVDAVHHVGPGGEVTTLATFPDPSPFGVHGLARVGPSLFTFDRPLVGPPTLVEVHADGTRTRHEGACGHHPVGLTTVGPHLVLLDEPLPETVLSTWRDGVLEPFAVARNLSHWRALGEDRLLWSDDAGIHEWRGDAPRPLVTGDGIGPFTRDLTYVRRSFTEGESRVSVVHAGAEEALSPAADPVALHRLATGTLVQCGRVLRRAGEARGRWTLLGDGEVGPLQVAGGLLLHLQGPRTLAWSADGAAWQAMDLPARCTRLVPAGDDALVASSRKGSVLLTFPSGGTACPPVSAPRNEKPPAPG